ncbi:hypothetical protein CY35_05G060400 [Sphagnum magellanicum]|nr:hypothetical protein CY35_05G060400 [Sphagnum magellanicum]KAH9562212.1 hypothetical protein CY35_05G060400 [Sphagnum magellanicum]KAH9562213.1 hypothetical protein CY35_05G060400 [Sphagnum magellanicum]
MGGQHSKREGPNGSPSSSSTTRSPAASSKILRNWSFPTKGSPPKRFTSSDGLHHGAAPFGQRYMRNGFEVHKLSSENHNSIEPELEHSKNFTTGGGVEDVIDNNVMITCTKTWNPWTSKRLRTDLDTTTTTTTTVSFQSQEPTLAQCGVFAPASKGNENQASSVERIADKSSIPVDNDASCAWGIESVHAEKRIPPSLNGQRTQTTMLDSEVDVVRDYVQTQSTLAADGDDGESRKRSHDRVTQEEEEEKVPLLSSNREISSTLGDEMNKATKVKSGRNALSEILTSQSSLVDDGSKLNPGETTQESARQEGCLAAIQAWDSLAAHGRSKELDPRKDPTLYNRHSDDFSSDAFSWGLLNQTDLILGFDSTCLMSRPEDISIPKGNSTRQMRSLRKRVRAPGRRRRTLRASSPKPVSSLQSCLSAQTFDDSDQDQAVDWHLNFPSLDIERERQHDVVKQLSLKPYHGISDSSQTANKSVCAECHNEETHVDPPSCDLGFRGGEEHSRRRSSSSNSSSGSSSAAAAENKPYHGMMGNGTPPFLCSATSRSLDTVKKPRIQQFFSTSSDLGINKTHSKGWTERLIFAIGVSVGAMGMVLRCDAEVKELRELLAEAQEQVQTLMHELEKLGGFVSEQQGVQTQCQLFMAGSGKMDEFSSGKGASLETNKNLSSDYDDESILGVLTVEESHLVRDQFSNDENHMAELEAELEAELDRLTGNNLVHVDDDDDDGEVDIVYGGLSVEDLPEQFKHIDDGDNDNDDTEFKDPRFVHEFEHETAVSPRELTCLLHKLQATRQQELITELEEELDNLQRQLEVKDSELELWKSGIRRLSKIWTPESTPGNEVLSLTNPIFEKTCPDDDMDVEIKTPEASNFHVPFQELGSSEEGSKQSRQLFVTPATLWRENWIWNQQEDVHSADEDSVDLENEDCPADTSPEFDENVCDEFLQALVDCGGV